MEVITLRDAILGGYALILGGYGFTWACYTMLSKKIDNLITNHLSHLGTKKQLKRLKK